MSDEKYSLFDAEFRGHQAEASMMFILRRFGDYLAQHHGYRRHKNIDAIHYYLIQKHNWLPSQVKSLSYEDLYFLVEEDMADFELPEPAQKFLKKVEK